MSFRQVRFDRFLKTYLTITNSVDIFFVLLSEKTNRLPFVTFINNDLMFNDWLMCHTIFYAEKRREIEGLIALWIWNVATKQVVPKNATMFSSRFSLTKKWNKNSYLKCKTLI